MPKESWLLGNEFVGAFRLTHKNKFTLNRAILRWRVAPQRCPLSLNALQIYKRKIYGQKYQPKIIKNYSRLSKSEGTKKLGAIAAPNLNTGKYSYPKNAQN